MDHDLTAADICPLESQPIHSPRLAALQARVAAHDPAALPAFWQELATGGTPLIEPIADAPGHRLVTFLWRDQPQDAAQAVLVSINTLTDRARYAGNLAPHLMARLAGTDVWFKSYRLRADLRASYQLYPYDRLRATLTPETSMVRPAWRLIGDTALRDPLNPRTIVTRADGPLMSVIELPDAPDQPWWQPRPEVPTGQLTEHTITSALLSETRRVWVYTPPGMPADQPYGVLVLFDGEVWANQLQVTATLDNLIASRQIPPLVALLIDSVDRQRRGRDLACAAQFANFLAHELLPWASTHWPLSQQPQHTIVSGQSLGGLMAAFTCLHSPARFGNALAQSGSFWWSDDGNDTEWLTGQYAANPCLPLRFHLNVGLLEWMLLPQNRRLRDTLLERGYDLSYHEYNAGHDYACWRGGLADGLLALCGRWA